MRVIIPGTDVEVATFRKDGVYEDGRRPLSVEISSPEEDAHRRDFTINALFYDPSNKDVKDFVEGKKDLRARLIRTVGRPEDRFKEDHLRILRAVRFVSQLDFNLEPKTQAAVTRSSNLVSSVSAERIHQEMEKLLGGKRPDRGIKLLFETQILKVILPEVKYEPSWVGMFKRIAGSPNQELSGWVILLEGVSKEDRLKIYSRLRFSNEVKKNLEETFLGIERFKLFSSLTLAEKKELSAQKTTVLALDYSI